MICKFIILPSFFKEDVSSLAAYLLIDSLLASSTSKQGLPKWNVKLKVKLNCRQINNASLEGQACVE